jgi:OMF family outer membrane factor
MAQEHYRFSSLDDLFRYAEENSVTFKNASHNVLMAKYQTLEAKMSMFNPRADAAFSTTDNLKQAVNYIPAFGD